VDISFDPDYSVEREGDDRLSVGRIHDIPIDQPQFANQLAALLNQASRACQALND
jgi:hypothetical protein